MKTQTQPQHTQGEWSFYLDGIYDSKGEMIASTMKDKDHYLKERNENIANAQRIVKAVNMYDELIDSLKAIKAFVNSASKEYPVSAKATLSIIDNLLKQAGQK